ncbi:MAG TPA: EAL domain-containing protein [Armatimonadota bacterium]|jgi:diguanylate cyclase (GGDEF)-like protein/PAS domain S-box-containing protein
MSLRTQTLWTTGVTLLGLIAVLYVAASRILMDGFTDLEAKTAITETQRVQAAIAGELAKLDDMSDTWAAWDDAYEFIRGRNPRFLTRNLTQEALSTTHADLVAFVNSKGQLVYGTGLDPVTGRKIAFPAEICRYAQPQGQLWHSPHSLATQKGILSLPDDLMMVASRPILTATKQGPIHGSVILGRWLDFGVIERVRRITGHDLTVQKLGSAELPVVFADARSALDRGKSVFTEPLDSETMAGYAYLRDARNCPVAIVRVDLSREVYSRGRVSLHYILLALLGVGFVFAAVTLGANHWIVVRPLDHLNDDVTAIQSARGTSARVRVEGADEFTRLAGNINDMLTVVGKAQAKRRESEELHRQMAQMALNASDALFVSDPATGELIWHGHVDEMLGYQPGAFPRDTFGFHSHIHPDDRDAVKAAFERSALNGEDFHIEFRIRRIGGYYDHWESRGKPLRDVTGKIDKVLGACTVITQRKRAEENLRASEERLARIVETNTDGIFIVDHEGGITFANGAAEALFGYTREDLAKRPFSHAAWDVISADGHSLSLDEMPFMRVFATRRNADNVEIAIRNAQGCRIVLTVNAAPLHDAQQNVVGVVTTVSDITERKTLEERLTYQAFHDPLTGLANRALFLERLSRAMTRSDRTHKPVGVLFLDLDNFKFINDSLGHAMGDQLLISVARRLERCLRNHDTAARFGGDEFTVVAEEIGDAEEAMRLAQRILSEMQKAFMLGAREVFITPSIGVAVSGMEEVRAEELLRNADAAMYEAKTHGKARAEMFHPRLNTHALSRLEMVNDLRRALDRGELQVHYQPKVCMLTGETEGVEALARWNHPKRGYIPPTEFIPIAEQSSLIIGLGRWVLTEACRQMNAWHLKYANSRKLTVAVNLSARQFQDPNLVKDVAHILEETGLDPNCLTLEITESVIMEEAESTIQTLTALKALGLHLAIDDFGTGYSSLSYLKRFPMDFVKIDRSFVDGLGRDSDDTVIVSATTSLAHALGLTVVAEGAETADQVQRLRDIGCDLAQGYWYSHALDASSLEAYLRRVDHAATVPLTA